MKFAIPPLIISPSLISDKDSKGKFLLYNLKISSKYLLFLELPISHKLRLKILAHNNI
jgi:hypothetical protein